MSQRTLVLVKPDVRTFYPKRSTTILSDILRKYGQVSLIIEDIKMFTFTDELVAKFYEEKLGMDYYESIRVAMTEGPTIAIIFSGDDAVRKVRAKNGATNPLEALPGTIRHLYGRPERGPYNAVHGSDSEASAEREIELIFGSSTIGNH